MTNEGEVGFPASPGADKEKAAGTVATVVKKLEPVVRGARSMRGTVRGIAIVFSVSAASLWLLLFLPMGPVTWWRVVLWVAAAVLLAVPGAVWVMISIGLGQIIRLPEELAAFTGEGLVHVDAGVSLLSAPGGIIRRIFSLLRAIVDLRSTAADSKAILVQSATLIRMFNPATMVVAVSTFAGGVIILAGLLIAALIKDVI